MLTVDKELKNFFEDEIFNDEDEVNDFLDQYDCKSVIQCLFEELKSLAENPQDLSDLMDTAWRLGRVFAFISKRYSIDQKIYSFLDNCNTLEKTALFSFLSGYWYGTQSHIETVLCLSGTLLNLMPSEREYSENSTMFILGVESLVSGYFSYLHLSKIDNDIDHILKERLRLFTVNLSRFSYSKFSTKIHQLVDCVQSLS
jgi:hypothetical protein